ncbi:MAG: hypothetical protein NWS83_10295, partial [Burkholderiaceae bacterium]|nr:hypothetical protein [Burkholderiaceae bacterium]
PPRWSSGKVPSNAAGAQGCCACATMALCVHRPQPGCRQAATLNSYQLSAIGYQLSAVSQPLKRSGKQITTASSICSYKIPIHVFLNGCVLFMDYFLNDCHAH